MDLFVPFGTIQVMSKINLTGKQIVLLILASVTIWLARPSTIELAHAHPLGQADSSPLESPSQENAEQRNSQGDSANQSTQNQSPLTTLELQESNAQQGQPIVTTVSTVEPTATVVPTETSTETPIPLPSATLAIEPTEAQPPLPPTEIVTDTLASPSTQPPLVSDEEVFEEPSEEPTQVPAGVEPEIENAYPPEDDAVPRENSTTGSLVVGPSQGTSASVDRLNATADPFRDLLSLESMILALLCLIFVSINGLGVVALVVTMLYIRSRRD